MYVDITICTSRLAVVVVRAAAAALKTSVNARLTLSTLQGLDEPTATRTIMTAPGVFASDEVVWLFIILLMVINSTSTKGLLRRPRRG